MIGRGEEVWRTVFGDAGFDEQRRRNDDLDLEMNEYDFGVTWGLIFGRPGLDLRTRMLCSVATLLTLWNLEEGLNKEIERYMKGALRVGAKPQEIVEVILQTGLWAGVLRWKAGDIAVRVFKDMGYRKGVDWASPMPDGWRIADLKGRISRGEALSRRQFGAPKTEHAAMNDAFDPVFRDYLSGFRWGTISARPGLDQRTRELCAVATFLVFAGFEQGLWGSVERHTRAALREGANPQEVVEVVYQTGLWAGIYKTTARATVLKVFQELGYREGVDWGRTD
jgi:alkylhydroperoxidase/carboxymuconolactone decarboxylase family protein YurZ